MLYLLFRRVDGHRDFDFPQIDYDNFLAAESKGRFLSEIRDCFRYEQLARPQTV
ncbi:MAG TPA: hypothetical protein VGM43_20465 [Bryobacteraceae bacterium]|jgi:hypothetical protein